MSIYTALVTPFKYDGSLDMESFERLFNHQLDNKVDGIVLFGTTGEAPTLETEEKMQILSYVVKCFEFYPKLKEKIIIGFSGNNTKKVLEEINKFNYFGFKNYMLSAPYYNKPTQEGLFQHFITVMEKFPFNDFMIYNIPSRTGVNIKPETIKRICEKCPNYLGVKEASGDLEQVKKLVEYKIPVFSGDDGLAYEVMKLGGNGVVSVASNLFPLEVRKFLTQENKHISDLYNLLFVETNPTPIKYLLEKFKMITESKVRLPLVDLEKSSKDKINEFFNKNYHWLVEN